MPTLQAILEQLARHEPRLAAPARGPRLEAAVAMVLHDSPLHGPAALLIQRAEFEGDPWSGHMAFPGGRRDEVDLDPSVTAARETLEEVGIELPSPIARLDDFFGTRNPRVGEVCVAPFVYVLERRPELIHNHEVRSTVWIPLRWMLDPASAVSYRITRPDGSAESFPAVQYEGYRVWGLTYRILTGFFGILGRDLPRPMEVNALHQHR